jgi:ferric iron reductase protein FhuF
MGQVRAVLTTGPGNPDIAPAIVGSLTHLGLVARLVSPLLGTALLTGVLPLAPVGRVHVRLAGANPLPLAVATSGGIAVRDAEGLATTFCRSWLEPAVGPLTAAVRASCTVSPRVLQGNVTSAVAGSLRMAAAARPDLTAAADAALEAFLHGGPLAGTGHRRDDGSFVRRSCCLLYRLPGAGTCGDCILDHR